MAACGNGSDSKADRRNPVVRGGSLHDGDHNGAARMKRLLMILAAGVAAIGITVDSPAQHMRP